MLLLLLALARAGTLSEVVLDDGQTLQGSVERQEDGSVVVTLGSGTMLRFPAVAVREVREVTPAPVVAPVVADCPKLDTPLPDANPGGARTPHAWERDPNRNRYMYAPSGFTLGKGHGYVSQKEILLTEAAYGVTDFWDIQAGTSLITVTIPGAAIGVLGTKVAAPITPTLRVGGGAQGLFADGLAMAAVFGTVTLGTEDRHVSFNAGTTVISNGEDVRVSPGGIVIVSGNYRLGPRVALLSENWILLGSQFTPTGEPLWLVPAFAVRLFGPSFATDLGLVPLAVPNSGVPFIPIPWVGFTWNYAMPNAD